MYKIFSAFKSIRNKPSNIQIVKLYEYSDPDDYFVKIVKESIKKTYIY